MREKQRGRTQQSSRLIEGYFHEMAYVIAELGYRSLGGEVVPWLTPLCSITGSRCASVDLILSDFRLKSQELIARTFAMYPAERQRSRSLSRWVGMVARRYSRSAMYPILRGAEVSDYDLSTGR